MRFNIKTSVTIPFEYEIDASDENTAIRKAEKETSIEFHETENADFHIQVQTEEIIKLEEKI